uniref:Uncharacterized protein n=1 Tax=Vespula pensylvanica TaxID=30213 RepID=A0A834P6W3_VESPE|nr:hypothetical protein H0235_004291 [Vespula pensylvanica]
MRVDGDHGRNGDWPRDLFRKPTSTDTDARLHEKMSSRGRKGIYVSNNDTRLEIVVLVKMLFVLVLLVGIGGNGSGGNASGSGGASTSR